MSKEKIEEKKLNSEFEDDNVVTINLTTLVIIIAILIAIIGVFFYMYTKTSSEAYDNAKNQGLISNGNKEFNEESAINLLNSYLEVKSKIIANPQSVLETYGYATNKQFEEYDKVENGEFKRTDILYENIRNKLQDYITKDFFTKEYKNIYKESNGVIYVSTKNQPEETYEITKHEQEDYSKSRPTIKVWYKTKKDGQESAEKNMIVEYVYNNGKWTISNIR